MMELNRISSHMMSVGSFGLELGATTVALYCLREREKTLDLFELITGLRMNHAFIRPGGVAQDLPAGALERLREYLAIMPHQLGEIRALLDAGPDLPGPDQEHRLPRPGRAAWRWASPARSCAPPACRGTCARASPTAATRPTTSTCPPRTTCDVYGRYLIRMDECDQSLRIIEQCLDRLSGSRPADDPVMIENAKIGWPAQLALGPDGMGNSPDHIAHIMSQSMEALIHHFKLVTEGFRVPAGQVYAAVESPRGELGCHAVSDGGTRPYRVALPRPVVHQPAVALAAMCEGGMVADVIAAVASIDPVLGGVDR